MPTPDPAPIEAGAVSPLIRERWACPRCRGRRLQEAGDRIDCPGCSATYPCEAGAPLFLEPSPRSAEADGPDLTLVVLALNERENVRRLLPDVQLALAAERIRYEILVVDGGSTDGTPEVASALGARVHRQQRRGYGGAVAEALRTAGGRYVLMMDADLSHPAPFVAELWKAREQADVLVASRYVPGARFEAPWVRKLLSRILNVTFRHALTLPIHDVSSGFRLYRTAAVRDIDIQGTNFEALEELLIKAFLDGRRLGEIPFNYEPRREGSSHVHFVTFGIAFARTLHRMWVLRNSMAAADYEDRAFDSRVPLQRYWQRARYATVMRWMRDCPGVVLDVGCGSSRVVQDLPYVVGVDALLPKVRYVRRKGAAVVQASVFELPFAEQTFDGLVCTQVVEHLAGGGGAFAELFRVLKPGGRLVVGTPDYGRPYWPAIERLYQSIHPNGRADEHLTRYTRATLVQQLERAGFAVLEERTIVGAELNVLARRT